MDAWWLRSFKFSSVLRRDKAEQTIWNRLKQLGVLRKKRPKTDVPLKIGVLGKSCVFFCLWMMGLDFFLTVWVCSTYPGCMAERLKTELLEREQLVDVIAGPDAYRDLLRLLSLAHGGQRASNVLLSLEETYADVMPVHHAGHSAFVWEENVPVLQFLLRKKDLSSIKCGSICHRSI